MTAAISRGKAAGRIAEHLHREPHANDAAEKA